MTAIPALRSVQALEPHWLYLEYEDGVSGKIDLGGRLFGPVFEPLRDAALFAKVAIDEFGAPCWPNGADVAPDVLYELLRGDAHGRLQSDPAG